MQTIGLFPLGIVLFPESILPLHIFEERYKKLISHCFEKKIPFGINLITHAKMYDIGCTAMISDIIKYYDDGKMDIIITGISRYKLVNFQEVSEPYYIGNIEILEDEPDILNRLLIIECIELFNKIADNIKSVKIDKLNYSKLHTQLPSYFIAQKSGLSPVQKQDLLEIRTENKRLAYLIAHLNNLLPIVKEAEYISNLIKNDGYYKPKYFQP